jgi:hypothetical protein
MTPRGLGNTGHVCEVSHGIDRSNLGGRMTDRSWKHTLAPPLITGTATLLATVLTLAIGARQGSSAIHQLVPGPTVTTTATVSPSQVPTVTVTQTVTATPTVDPLPVAGDGLLYLADMEPVEGGLSVQPRTILKHAYAHPLANEMGGCGQAGPAEWVLPSGATRFKAQVGLDDRSLIPTARVAFAVSVDGKPVTSKTVGLKQLQSIDVPVSGALRLKLETTLVEGNVRNNCNTEAVAVWGDAQLLSG